MPQPAAPAAGPSTWPPSARPSPRLSKTPATCTSPKAAATIRPPPKPSAFTGSIKTDADIRGTRRSPEETERQVADREQTGVLGLEPELDQGALPCEQNLGRDVQAVVVTGVQVVDEQPAGAEIAAPDFQHPVGCPQPALEQSFQLQ